MATVYAPQFFHQYAALLERIELRGAHETNLSDTMQLLGILYGAGELRAEFRAEERDALAGHLIRSAVNGTLDEYAAADLEVTRRYLQDEAQLRGTSNA